MKQQDLLVFELQRYVFGETTLDEFQDWLVPYTWSPPKAVAALAEFASACIAERAHGYFTEKELKDALRKELENYV